ncbi:tetratricopeptide repeat protein [Algibacter amylolyticus]|uniref:Tetratricopeptide repeat protein n=1 Tax=Algibacter amylolyticus TaxID=1608400 RepID=A0A5M7BDB3_9FLAO|nr:tetratricopeptide repeat protein [Algibacter amylolyticus]KAA5827636.1 tetratricopeptide repeat protein [Algibacter amylolyticus]MBB5266849.1 tetratricopeptide (TPR) repeat protein [Algibacter amylolyticus]TSJ81881.1 tetratricopeptide repeat protein [Algibacter amylolyticus]
MKQFIFLVMLLWGLNSYSQNYESNYKADICACIEAQENTQQLPDKIYNACFTKHMTTYAAIIDAQIKEEDKTKKFIAGQQVRRDLNQKFKYDLAYVCDAYIDIIEGKKQHALQQLRSRTIDSSKIEKLNENVAMVPHYSSYYNRGQYYYQIGDLNNAERDIKKSIQENPLNQDGVLSLQESLLLALIYEGQKRYSEAIAIYDAVNAKAIHPSVELLKAIAYRKSKGYVLKPKVVLKEGVEPVVAAKEKIEKPPVKATRRSSQRVPAPNTEQNNTTSKRTRTATRTGTSTVAEPANKQAPTKSKDSTKNLRGLFKLD